MAQESIVNNCLGSGHGLIDAVARNLPEIKKKTPQNMSFRIAGILSGIRISHLPSTRLQGSGDANRLCVICNNRYVGTTM